MIVIQHGTPEWYEARLGVPTASMFHKIITPGGKPCKAETTRVYQLQLLAEKLLNISSEDETRVAMMERGKLLEGDAAKQFSEVYGYELEPGGFIYNKDLKAGASPDLLLKGKNEAAEIKSPAAHTLLGYHLDGLGKDYRPQLQGQILIGNFDAVHFYAYHPRCPAFYQLVLPDFPYISDLQSALAEFNAKLEADLLATADLGHFQRVELAREIQAEVAAITVLDAG